MTRQQHKLYMTIVWPGLLLIKKWQALNKVATVKQGGAFRASLLNLTSGEGNQLIETRISSSTKEVIISDDNHTELIGERINPANKKKL
jgi:hypothetical protein